METEGEVELEGEGEDLNGFEIGQGSAAGGRDGPNSEKTLVERDVNVEAQRRAVKI